MQPGDLIGSVEVGPVAHGGHCVARVDGRVIFVRHALPGELVTVRITEVSKRFARGDAVQVERAAPERVSPPCPNAGLCGGCDFQHVDVAFQAELKRRVLAEQLERLASLSWDGTVEPVPPALGSRTRMRFVADGDGRLGLRAHRSHAFVPLPDGGCRIADPAMVDPSSPVESGNSELIGVVSDEGGGWYPPTSDAVVTQRVGDRTFEVQANGFWQSHVEAPRVLTAAVLEGLRPQPGERALDLFCGVGVFAGALVDAGCRVWGIEGNKAAVRLARSNVPEATFVAGDVARSLAQVPDRVDLVVLDPPRAGAGAAVMKAVAARCPRAIAYVACDPAALARDLATAGDLGYRPVSIRGFDLFAMTHHLEAVAILTVQ